MSDLMFDLFSWNTPNGQKIIIALEEVGVDYTFHPVDISQGEQHEMAFRRLSPDGKIPALISRGKPHISLFESGAILVYLADAFPQLHGEDATERAQVLSWTFWQVGQLGPLAGQFGRFSGQENPDAHVVKHFEQLVWRCLHVMEAQLENSDYLAGSRFTVADIACYPWIASQQSYLQRFDIQWRDSCPALARWAKAIGQRPSAIKAQAN